MKSVFNGAEYAVSFTHEELMAHTTVIQKLAAGLRLTQLEHAVLDGWQGVTESALDCFESGAAPFSVDELGNVQPLVG
ncbi:hypothetical protein OH786_23145 [Streptomyces atratus]|uniref:hypothetical protein n=1 Tax=Streptomyces atratus TaxID=1893 RepID=UPI003869C765